MVEKTTEPTLSKKQNKIIILQYFSIPVPTSMTKTSDINILIPNDLALELIANDK